MKDEFSRTELLIGRDNLDKLKNSWIAVFGIGGVGSFTVEGLIRAGIGKISLIDFDDIDITNINRQIHATQNAIGMPKVEVMKKRVLDINPSAEVIAHKELFNSQNSEMLLSNNYDYVVDAIDMVSSKLELISKCKEKNIPIISSMGMGNKLNPTFLRVSDISKTSMCPLAKVIRKELRKRDILNLKVVYSNEQPIKPKNHSDNNVTIKQVTGSISFVPSTAGLIIASEVAKDILFN